MARFPKKFMNHKVDEFHSQEFEVKRIDHSQWRSLDGFVEDWQLFSIAIPYLAGIFEDQMFWRYARIDEVELSFLKFAEPVFSGMTSKVMPRPVFDFVLWASRKHVYDDFENYIRSINVADRISQRYGTIGVMDLNIRDPAAVDFDSNNASAGLVDIKLFGASTNRDNYHVIHAAGKLPQLTRSDPDPAIVSLAKRYFHGK